VRKERKQRRIERSLREVRMNLARPLRHANLGGVASLIASLRQEKEWALENESLIDNLTTELLAKIRESELSVVDSLMGYAVTIADNSSSLIFEDAFKLLSLCDDIQALRGLGIEASAEVEKEFRRAVRGRLKCDKEVFTYAAQSLVEDWKRDLWWYAEILK